MCLCPSKHDYCHDTQHKDTVTKNRTSIKLPVDDWALARRVEAKARLTLNSICRSAVHVESIKKWPPFFFLYYVT